MERRMSSSREVCTGWSRRSCCRTAVADVQLMTGAAPSVAACSFLCMTYDMHTAVPMQCTLSAMHQQSSCMAVQQVQHHHRR